MTPKALFRKSAMWCIVLFIYMLLLAGIGWIAFWDQGFNDPQKTVGGIIDALHKCKIEAQAVADGQWDLTHDEYAELLKSLIEDADNESGDLQELASQSFNIVLGAILAFLSASATMVFQSNGEGPEGEVKGAEASNKGKAGGSGEESKTQATEGLDLWDDD